MLLNTIKKEKFGGIFFNVAYSGEDILNIYLHNNIMYHLFKWQDYVNDIFQNIPKIFTKTFIQSDECDSY
jgi:hypothetical protein